MKRAMRITSWVWAVLAALMLSSCDSGAVFDYRYRLTVEVETTEGLKTGSSVIQVRKWLGRAGGAPASSQIYTRVRGEAVEVDLPGEQTLFALLRSDSNIQWAGTIVSALTPRLSDADGKPRFDGVLQLKGEVELPRYLRRSRRGPGPSAYPMLVTFGDLGDPTSVERVDPDDLAATFGEGARLKRVTVQLTDDRVTTGIEKRLGWLPDYYDKQLSGDRFQMLKNKHKGLSAFISSGVFSAGVGVREDGAD